MPNAAQDQDKRLEYSEDDVEKMMGEFEEHDPVKAQEQKERAAAIENLIEEGLEEAESQENAREQKHRTINVDQLIDLTVEQEARALSKALSDPKEAPMLLSVADVPEMAESTLLDSLTEAVRRKVDQEMPIVGKSKRLEAEGMLADIVESRDADIRAKVRGAVLRSLESRLDEAKNADEFDKLSKLIAILEKGDEKAA